MSMFMWFGFMFFLYAYGATYIVFAFREPPPLMARAFNIRLPLVFLLLLGFVRDEDQVKVGRLATGGLLILGAVVSTLRMLYGFLFGW